MKPVAGRLQAQEGRSGARIIDDTYNANPGSLQAAIDYLAGTQGQRWLVLGNMGELGDAGDELHRQAGPLWIAFIPWERWRAMRQKALAPMPVHLMTGSR